MNPNLSAKRTYDLALAGIFGLILWLPSIIWLCSFEKTTTDRKHWVLAAFPELALGVGLGSLQNYNKQVENHFNQGFGGRNILNACNIRLKYQLFSDDMGPDVLRGTDGWYYYQGEDLVDDRLGFKRLSDQRLRDWQDLLEKRRDWLAARGIRYLVVIAPNKESVHSEHLPRWLRQPSTTRLDRFLVYMRLHSTVEILDLRPVLRTAGRFNPVYYQTDTHWNLMGGFVASEAIVAELHNQLPEMRPLEQGDFEIKQKRGPAGDLSRLSKVSALIEANTFTFEPKQSLPMLNFCVQGTNVMDNQQFTVIPFPVIDTVTTANERATSQIMVFGDSFIIGLVPFLGYHFGQVDFFWKDTLDKEFIRKNQPSIVVNEIVERHFNRGNPVFHLLTEASDAN